MAPGQIKCPHCGAQSSSSANLCYNCNGDLRATPSAPASSTAAAMMTTSAAIQYDPVVIQSYAKHLYARANMVTVVYALIGALFLAATFGTVGAVADSIEAGLVLGALAGGSVGYFIGNMKANALRLEAQLAMCQVQIEMNTRVE